MIQRSENKSKALMCEVYKISISHVSSKWVGIWSQAMCKLNNSVPSRCPGFIVYI